MKDIEFNNGFVTALALFYGHRLQFQESSKIAGHDMRIYGAADHLFDLEYPKGISDRLKRKISEFIRDVLTVRLENITLQEGDKLFDRCLQLLEDIDKETFELKVIVKYY